nr:NADH-quinone oxidoreductase subunit NuoE [Candidatus Competibacter phosphatis]
MSAPKSDLLSAHARAEIDEWVTRYPADRKQSAVLAALREVQHENGGYLTTELMDAVAEYLEMPPIAVYEVATFYSMFELKPVGRHSISVCTNISCMLRGGDAILAHIEKKLGIRLGESTTDGKFFSEAGRRMSGGMLWGADDAGRSRLLRAPDPRESGSGT